MKLFFYVVLLYLRFQFAQFSKDDSTNWDPDCTTKWPGCKRDGISYLNTACDYENCDPRSSDCTELPSDAKFRQMVMDIHNELRNKVASGEENRSGIVSASDMMAFSYDLGLEFTSICHVHGCLMTHDKCRGTARFRFGGQNLAKRYWKANKPIPESKIKELIKDKEFGELVTAWYETEIGKDNFTDLINNFTRTNHDTGHFTAMIWAKSTHLGCAKALQRGNPNEATIHITCNYAGPGNVKNRPMYIKGDPCSNCPKETSCNSKYTSLCGEIDDKDVNAGPNPYREIDKNKGVKNSKESIYSNRSVNKFGIPLLRTLILIMSSILFVIIYMLIS